MVKTGHTIQITFSYQFAVSHTQQFSNRQGWRDLFTGRP